MTLDHTTVNVTVDTQEEIIHCPVLVSVCVCVCVCVCYTGADLGMAEGPFIIILLKCY